MLLLFNRFTGIIKMLLTSVKIEGINGIKNECLIEKNMKIPRKKVMNEK